MKLTTVAVILATAAAAHLIVAGLPYPDPREKQQSASFLQPQVPVQDNEALPLSLPSIVESIDPSFERKKRKKKFRWNKGMFSKAVNSLGILRIPGLKLVTVKKEFMHSLEKAKGHMIEMRKRRPSSYHKYYRNERNSKPQKRVLHDLCQETVDSIFVLAHADESLAYKVETILCEGTCYSSSLKLPLGECVLKRKTMVVYVFDQTKNLVPKTVDVGCACECLTSLLK
ncbi:uncharacterized protein LOC116298943 [Actinia tenebrosa]|uniref:Uncharacterized protein LOC116298943 n=1 Tax=Actinia tenebrosa TaxID=6105 RepID=A0A6P8ICF5_ACTTE|nr:uncharacterized protein LOC116298943 [Actinia tenebrosa]